MFSAPDEGAHVVRAAATVRGQWVGRTVVTPFGPTRQVEVPAVFAADDSSTCLLHHPERSAACVGHLPAGGRSLAAFTSEYRNPPAYYLAVGWPSLLGHTQAALWAMRLLSAAICAGLVGLALATAARMGGLAVVGVLAALTPLAAYLVGTVNPNSVEIAAAICAWTGVAALARRAPGAVPVAGVGLTSLVLCRGLSLLWAVAAMAALIVLLGRSAAVGLLRRRDVRWWAGAVCSAAALAAAWILTVGLKTPVHRRADGLLTAAQRAPALLRNAVDLLGNLDFRLPWPVVVAWAALSVVLLLRAPLAGLVLLAAVCVGITADGANLPPVGFWWEARFGLPLLAGAPILAGALGRSVRAAPWLAGALGGAQVAAFAAAGRRFGTGTAAGGGPLRYLWRAAWSPPVPAALLLAAAVGACGLMTLEATRSGRPAAG